MACLVNCKVKTKFQEFLTIGEGVDYCKQLEEEFKNFKLKRYHDRLFSSPAVKNLLEEIAEFRGSPEHTWVVDFHLIGARRYEHKIVESDAAHPPLILGLGMNMKVQFDDGAPQFNLEPGVLLTMFPSNAYKRWTITVEDGPPAFLMVHSEPDDDKSHGVWWKLCRL